MHEAHLGKMPCTASSSFSACCVDFQLGFQLVGLVEMVFDGAFVAPGDEDQIGYPGFRLPSTAYRNQRFVHDGQHFLRAGLVAGSGRVPMPAKPETRLLAHGFARRNSLRRPKNQGQPASASSAASSSTGNAQRLRLVQLLPAASPATTKSVFRHAALTPLPAASTAYLGLVARQAGCRSAPPRSCRPAVAWRGGLLGPGRDGCQNVAAVISQLRQRSALSGLVQPVGQGIGRLGRQNPAQSPG